MSDGLGNWVGKEVKVEWILKIRETCMTCMCLVCVMCVSKGNNTGSNGKDSLTGLPNPAEMWDSGGIEVWKGRWEAGECWGEVVISGSVLVVIEGLWG